MREIKSNKNSPLKKIFVKLCRIFGFEVIDQSNFTIPTSNKSMNESIKILQNKRLGYLEERICIYMQLFV